MSSKSVREKVNGISPEEKMTNDSKAYSAKADDLDKKATEMGSEHPEYDSISKAAEAERKRADLSHKEAERLKNERLNDTEGTGIGNDENADQDAGMQQPQEASEEASASNDQMQVQDAKKFNNDKSAGVSEDTPSKSLFRDQLKQIREDKSNEQQPQDAKKINNDTPYIGR